jgi:hypothetical protein
MGVRDVTRNGVLKAIAECDAAHDERAFLQKGGFGRAREYVLLHHGKPYASKAIIGVAHGYDRPDLGPLDRHGLSGGTGPRGAATILERLGFEVVSSAPEVDSAADTGALTARAPYLLYISKEAEPNIAIGVASGVWGLPERAVETTLSHLAPPRTGREVLEQIAVGDLILAASRGPSPRVPGGTWTDVTLDQGVLWRVTRPYHFNKTKIWPGSSRWPTERYPHRFGIEVLEDVAAIDRTSIGSPGMEALWYSANNRGVVLPPPFAATADPAPAPKGPSSEGAELLLHGDLDVRSLVKARREQGKARTTLLRGRTNVECDLCGRSLPAACSRVAHIKRRSACTGLERRQLRNLMLACTLGCDHLFEFGYVYVDLEGRIRRGLDMATTPDLDVSMAALVGLTCRAHNAVSEPFFAWHRQNRHR